MVIAGEKGWGNRYTVSAGETITVPEMEGGGGCTTMNELNDIELYTSKWLEWSILLFIFTTLKNLNPLIITPNTLLLQTSHLNFLKIKNLQISTLKNFFWKILFIYYFWLCWVFVAGQAFL
jgi:hypothetical protein